MSLLSSAMETYTKLVTSFVRDSYGAQATTWAEGSTFTAAAVLDNTVDTEVGSSKGIAPKYTITTSRDVNLQFHDVIRRESDGKVFRVLTDGDDKKTPASAGLDMRQVKAEEWILPDGGATDE